MKTDQQGADQAPWPRDPDQYGDLSDEDLDSRICEALDSDNLEEAIDLVGHLHLRSQAAEDDVQVDACLDFRRALGNIVAGEHLAAMCSLLGPNDIELDARRRALRPIGEGLRASGETALAAHAFWIAKDPRADELLESLGIEIEELVKQFPARWTQFYRARIEEDPADAFALYQSIKDLSGVDWDVDDDDDEKDDQDDQDDETEIDEDDIDAVLELAYDAIRDPDGLHEAYRELVSTLAEYERFDEAMRWAERAARLWPHRGEIYYYLGVRELDQYRDENALEAFRRCLSMEYDWEYVNKFSDLLLRMERWKELADLSERWFALEKDQGNLVTIAYLMQDSFKKTSRRLPDNARAVLRKSWFRGPKLELTLTAVAMVAVILYFAFCRG